MLDEHFDTYYDREYGEERVVIGGRLYRVLRHTQKTPDPNRFISMGAGGVSWEPIDEAGNPVAAKRWSDPFFVEGELTLVRENFECVRLLDERGRSAYPGPALDDLRAHLQEFQEDFEVLEDMYRSGELRRLNDLLEKRLVEIEVEDGLFEGAMRQGRRTLSEQYTSLARRIRELAPAMERWGILAPKLLSAAGEPAVVARAGTG